jgi:hypothetical protein
MANALSSRTSAVAGTTVTHKVPAKRNGVVCYLKYTKGDGTNVAIVFTFNDPELGSDDYQQMFINPTNGQVVVQNFQFSADGNYRIPLPVAAGESMVKAAVNFTGGITQELVVDFRID